MKAKYIATALLAFTLTAGCKQNRFDEYSGGDCLYFADVYDPTFLYGFSNFFDRNALKDTVKTYTFYYDDPSVTSAEVLFDLYTTGGPKEYDRQFRLEQIMEEDAVNAVPGVNYEAFDSERMSEVYVLKAGDIHMRIPIVVKRSDDLETYSLRFRVVGNDHFQPGPAAYIWRKVVFTSTLQRPDKWSDAYYGTYSRTKHEWMIEINGFRWDNEFMGQLATDATKYWSGKMKTLIREINDERAANDLGPWEDENGVGIAMGPYA